jgi:putative photosynthetic complex assembly protein
MTGRAKHEEIFVPKPAIYAATGMIMLTIVMAAIASWTGFGKVRVQLAPAAETRELRFEDDKSGGIAVFDAGSQDAFAILQPGQDGFVRSVLRGMAHDRRMQGIGSGPAFRLNRLVDGRLTLEDPATGRTMLLDGFGHENIGSFAKLLVSTTTIAE